MVSYMSHHSIDVLHNLQRIINNAASLYKIAFDINIIRHYYNTIFRNNRMKDSNQNNTYHYKKVFDLHTLRM